MVWKKYECLRRPEKLAVGAFFCAIFMLTACGHRPQQYSNRTNLAGKITYKGKPVSAGTVTVYSKVDHLKMATSSLKEDGTFFMSDAPVGLAVIIVSTESARMFTPELFVEIPSKYANRSMSDITTDIQPNSAFVDFNLD